MEAILQHIAEFLGVKKLALVAGGIGAAVSMPFIEGTLPRKLSLFVSGWAASVFASPVLIRWMDVGDAEYGVVFLVGVFAMSITDAIIRSLKDVTFTSIMENLRLMFGRNK